jgi:hypothetical protein
MTAYASYYMSKFRGDFFEFFSGIPDKSKFHEDILNKETFSIQYERLTRDFGHVEFLDRTEKEYFAIALFFTVLTDMVCFSYYKNYYEKFRKLTSYPKFIGNCPGGCHYHYHPSDIFAAINKGFEISSKDRLDFYKKFNEAVSTMENEIVGFFHEYLNEIDGQLFWQKCKNEFPFKLKNELSEQ